MAKSVIRMGLVLLILLTMSSTALAEDAIIKFINNSAVYVRFYVDDIPSGACPPGDYAVTTASLGNHVLTAVAPGGQTLQTSITLDSRGFEWTITGSPE